MKSALRSFLATVAFLGAFRGQIGFAQTVVTEVARGPFRLALKAREKRTVNFYKEFFREHIPAVIRIGERTEEPTEITDVRVQPPDAGLAATWSGFQLRFATDLKVAKSFAVTVAYRAQPKVYQRLGRGRLGWVKDGSPQPRTLEIQAAVRLPALTPVAVKVGEETRWTLPEPATDPIPNPKLSGLAEVKAEAGKALIIRGKRPGSESFDIKYRVGSFEFADSLSVEVVDRRETRGEALEVKKDLVILSGKPPPALKVIRLIAVEDLEVCGAVQETKGLRLTGLKEGKNTVTAVAVEPGGKRVRVDIAVMVRGISP